MENEELYRRAQAGEAGAFEQLHKQLANFIRSIALESCRHFGCTDVVSASLLEDLCAEGDLELWERIHSGGYDEHAGKLTTYLYPFLRGRMYRYLETNLGVMSLSKDEMERVRQAQRLYHVEGKSAEEIAVALHLSDEATARLVGYNTHFLSVFDLLGSEEEGDPFERLLSERQGASSEQIIYRKGCLELLEQLFQTLSAKDRSILGHTFGVYGYEKLSADELGLREMLSPDGVTKARKAALEHLRQRYPDSALYRWRRAFRKMRDV
jgi:RNA polymerase sigma factor (sigma-70 family)